MREGFDATLKVHISHEDGPVIADVEHVLTWLKVNGPNTEPEDSVSVFINGHVTAFWVCPQHPDPAGCADNCNTDDGNVAVYSLKIIEVTR